MENVPFCEVDRNLRGHGEDDEIGFGKEGGSSRWFRLIPYRSLVVKNHTQYDGL